MRSLPWPFSASRAFARLTCSLGVLLAGTFGGGGCGGPDNFAVLVLVENVPTDATQLSAQATLDGKTASNSLDVTNSLSRFGVRVPTGTPGNLTLNLQVLDNAKCVVAEGSVSHQLAAPEYAVTLNTRVTTLQPRRCPVQQLPTCSPALFCWSNPTPQGNAIRGMWTVGANDIWAVGDFGALMHYNGTAWQAVTSGVTDTLWSVWASGANEIFAVGDNGRILRSTSGSTGGGTFTSLTSGTTQSLFGVWGNGATDEVWAVGAAGTILKFDRATSMWGAASSPTTAQLNAVWGSAKNSVFAVGAGGVITKYNGTMWANESATGTSMNLLGVGGDAARTIAVGVSGTIVTNTGGPTWSGASGGAGTMYSVFGKAGTYWIAGAGGVRLRGDGTAFNMVTGDNEPGSFYAISGVDATNVWAGGDGGLLANYTTAWTPNPSLLTKPRQTIRAVYGFNNKDVWAVGTGGTILHYDGTTWTPSNSGTVVDLNGIWGAASNDLWVVGNARTILRYDGRNWAPRTLQSTDVTDLNAVWGLGTAGVWIVGAPAAPMKNVLIQFKGATEGGVVLTSTGTLPPLTAVWGTSLDDFWIGSGRSLVNVIPSTLNISQTNVGQQVRQIWGSRANDVWAVGDNGFITHYNGTGWTPATSPVSTNLSGVFGYADNDAWAVGDNGTVVHWDGTAWTTKNSLTRNRLVAVWGPTAQDLWAAGEYTTLLHTLK